ncbi:MAG: septum formation initiator family protein [Caldithrix sp.]|nr:MAG: septum formation initiator family protein [Caldithrix sp.]
MRSKKKWQGCLWGMVALAIVGYLGFGGDYNFYNLWRLHGAKEQLQAQIRQGGVERDLVLGKLDRLQHDPDYIEKIARERYNMVKPGEKVYLLREANGE